MDVILQSVQGIVAHTCKGFIYLFLLYVAWMWYDRHTCHRGGRRSEWVRSWRLWTFVCRRLAIRLVKTAPLDPNKNYVCGYHPHGALAVGAGFNFCSEGTGFSREYPGITPHLVVLDLFFQLPLIRDFATITGGCSASKDSFKHILSRQGKGNAIVVAVGGFNEACFTQTNRMLLTLRTRHGFVTQAIIHGADLVPMISFGENEVFKLPPNPNGSWLGDMLTILIYLCQVFHGMRPIHTVVGRPVEVTQCENPSQDMINDYHNQYVRGLQQLFDEYKTKLDHDDLTLTLR